MAFEISDAEVKTCLDELGIEFLRIGQLHCENLTDQSQLSAFILVGLRAISLSYVFPIILDAGCLDAYDVARRAVLEAYYLMNELRLKDSAKKVFEWHQGKGNSWNFDPKRWESIVLTEGVPLFAREYGEFSELAHPTFQAAQQSGETSLYRYGVPEHADAFKHELNAVRVDMKLILARLLNVTYLQDERYINIPFSALNLSHCGEVVKQFHRHAEELRRNEVDARRD